MRGSVAIDLNGIRFGRLLVLCRAASAAKGAHWHCKCDCGKEVVVSSCNLRRKKKSTKSCGCWAADFCRARRTTHGMSTTPEHPIWFAMLSRCHNPDNPGYHAYGGRGVTVCAKWRQNFSNFYTDMGPRPTSKHTLERIDNNSGYCPENCRWATRTEQSRNTTRNLWVKYRGEWMTLVDAAACVGVARASLVRTRFVVRGWSLEDAVETPTGRRGIHTATRGRPT